MVTDSSTGLSVLQSSVAECVERLAASGGSPRPRAAYRMQFHAGWRFQDATRLTEGSLWQQARLRHCGSQLL
jgi:hypothetical protein